MSLGTPVISSDCDFGPRDIIVDGKNGFLFSTNDFQDLSLKIQRMALNNKLRKKFSVEGKKTAKKFDLSRIYQRWNGLVNEVV